MQNDKNNGDDDQDMDPIAGAWKARADVPTEKAE
jgi:hypothetical protein